jgi:hypothetical protein
MEVEAKWQLQKNNTKFLFVCLFAYFETVPCYKTQAGLELIILLLQPLSMGIIYRDVPLCPVNVSF